MTFEAYTFSFEKRKEVGGNGAYTSDVDNSIYILDSAVKYASLLEILNGDEI
jgi:hypothetical protein